MKAKENPTGPLTVQESLGLLMQHSSAAIQCAYKAHLEIFQFRDDLIFAESCVANVLETLNLGIQIADTAEEVRFLQNQSSMILQSMMFHMHANLLLNKKKTIKKGKEIIKFSDQQYLKALKELLQFTVMYESSKKGEIAAGLITSLEISMPLEKSPNNFFGFLKQGADQYDGEAFHQTMDRIFGKLNDYSFLVGKSLILADLIRDHEKEVTLFYIKSYEKKSVLGNLSNSYTFIFLAIIAMVLYGVVHLLDVFSPTNLNVSSYFKFWYIFILFVPAVYYQIRLFKYLASFDSPYKELADALDPIGNN